MHLLEIMKTSFLHKPHLLFLVIALITGLICVLFIPLGLGFDEKAHTRRIWEMSGGTLIPNYLSDKINIFPVAIDDHLSIPPFFNDSENQFWNADYSEKIDWWKLGNGKSSSSYFPTLYIPQVLVMAIFGRNFNTPVTLLLYLVRLSCLLSFIVPTFFAIKVIPHSKWLFTTLALVPMALMQSGTISPEGLSNGFAFLFVAWMMRFLEHKSEKITKKQLALLILMISLLFTLKLNLIVLAILLFLIPRNRFRSKKQLVILIASLFILFGILVLGWNYLTRSSLAYNGNTPGEVLSQAKFILQKPFGFVKVLAKDIFRNFGNYYRGWIATFPNQNLGMPWYIHLIYSLAVLFLVLFDPTNQKQGAKKRVILILTGLLGYLFTVSVLFIKDTSLNSPYITGVQGRYFIPIFLLIIMGLAATRFSISTKIFYPLTISLLTIVPLLFSAAIILRYTTNCGLSFLKSEECFRPNYRNWAPNTIYSDPVIPGLDIRQTVLVDCDKFEKLQLWTDYIGQNDLGTTTIRIYDTSTGNLITEEKLENNQLAHRNWSMFSFPPINDSSGKVYEIDISSGDASLENAALFSFSYRQEYLDGELMINDQTIDTDLIFRFGCCVGLNCQTSLKNQ